MANGVQESNIVRIQVIDAEREAGALAPQHLEDARRALLEDGVVVLDDLVPVDIVDSLRERMLSDLSTQTPTSEDNSATYPGHFVQQPPSQIEHLHAEVVINPIVLGLCRSVLGDAITTLHYWANTNMPGSVRQNVHCDLMQLWPDLDPVPRSPFAVVFNLPLIDTDETCATELWPGTHVDGRTYSRDGAHRDIPQAWLDARRLERPPVQVPQRKGSVSLRDCRLWHTGVANTSDDVRIMITLGYAAAWYNDWAAPISDAVADLLADGGAPAHSPALSQQTAASHRAQILGRSATSST